MKKITIYSISLFLLFSLGLSIEAFAKNKTIKEKIADSYFNNLAYQKAIPFYLELYSANKDDVEVIRKTAICYNKVGNTPKALEWYRALYLKGGATLDDKYEYFLVLRKSKMYDESKDILKEYTEAGGSTEFTEFLKKHPNYLQDLKDKNTKRYKIDTVPFNTSSHEFCPIYYKDGIIFVSPKKGHQRRGIRRVFAWDQTNFLDMFYVEKTKDGFYTEPKRVDIVKNSKYHDGPVAFTPDFKEAYITRSNYSSSGRLGKSKNGTIEVNLFISKVDAKGKWSKLVPFKYNSDEYSTGAATISADGKTLVFASDKPGGMGETDLWMCTREDAKSEWGEPQHLSDRINTIRRDNYPYFDQNGSLYFASDGGLVGLGGYDIFYVPNFLSGNREPFNIGGPINSSKDDFGFIFDKETGTGYFNSGRDGVVGNNGNDDIFTFKRMVSLLQVQIFDKETKQVLPTAIVALKTQFGDILEDSIKLNDKAIFQRELSPKQYITTAKLEGYESGEITIDLPRGRDIDTIIELQKAKPIEEVVVKCPEITLEDIFYDFDKYVIRDDASVALDELYIFLTEFPAAKINLVAHTDSRGTHKYNDILSERRAKSAADYLINKGISADRISYRGAGERELLNRCSDGVDCSDREHQANRRTNVEVILDECVEISKKPNKYLEE